MKFVSKRATRKMLRDRWHGHFAWLPCKINGYQPRGSDIVIYPHYVWLERVARVDRSRSSYVIDEEIASNGYRRFGRWAYKAYGGEPTLDEMISGGMK